MARDAVNFAIAHALQLAVHNTSVVMSIGDMSSPDMLEAECGWVLNICMYIRAPTLRPYPGYPNDTLCLHVVLFCVLYTHLKNKNSDSPW